MTKPPAPRSEVNRSTAPGGLEPRQTLASEDSQWLHFCPKSTRTYLKCGQDVGRNQNGPDHIPEEMLVRCVIFGAPGGI